MPARNLSDGEIDELLNRQRIVRIAFDIPGERYLVPLGYVWMDGAFCCATTYGRKTRMAEINPRVSFQVDNSCEMGIFGWQSVTGEGAIEFVTQQAEVERLLGLLMKRFPEMPGWARKEYAAKHDSELMIIFRLRPRVRTGRAYP